jgi:lauroyl/myristoyl acyltransferase
MADSRRIQHFDVIRLVNCNQQYAQNEGVLLVVIHV